MARRGSLLLFTLIGLIFLADKSYLAKSAKGVRKVRLKFDEDGYFKIIQLADLHYGHFTETDEHTDKVGAIAQYLMVDCLV